MPPKTRPTTRASSVAGSATSSAGSTASKRAGRRGANAAGFLPPVGIKESTSYGSSTAAVPLVLGPRKAPGASLEDHLNHIVQALQPAIADQDDSASEYSQPAGRVSFVPARGARAGALTPGSGHGRGGPRRGNTATPSSVDLSNFGDASSIAGEAEIGDDSGITPLQQYQNRRKNKQVNGRGGFEAIMEEPEESEVPDSPGMPQVNEKEVLFESIDAQYRDVWDIARERREARHRATIPGSIVPMNWIKNIWDYVELSFEAFGLGIFWKIPFLVLRWSWRHPWKGFLLILAVSTIASSLVSIRESEIGDSIRFHGIYDVKHNIGQFVPQFLAHPLDYFNEDDVLDLQKRVSSIEYDVHWLKEKRKIDQTSLDYLNSVLPDHLVFKKDKSGHKVIPPDFWSALRRKITEDPLLLQDAVSRQTISSAIAEGQTSAGQVEKIAAGAWANFLDQNEAKIKAWQTENFNELWDGHVRRALENDVLVSKKEMIDIVTKTYQVYQRDIRDELARMETKLQKDINSQNAADPTRRVDSATKDQVATIARNEAKKLITAARLEAFSKTQTNQHVSESQHRVNYFAIGTGAVINPVLTSPPWALESARVYWTTRAWLWLTRNPLPTPRPATTALTRWEEAGDCFCAPQESEHAHGLELTVLLARKISPDTIIVEHIDPQATLEASSTPRLFEVIAQIDSADWDTQIALIRYSEQLFPYAEPEKILAAHWIRLGVFEFDNRVYGDNVQAFSLPVRLADFGVHTHQVMVRVLTNWGSNHTCLYRLRLHGDEVTKVTAPV